MATILVIDDQKPIRALLRDALVGDGHEVLEASNGLLGLERYRERAADLIITDILMPEMNGAMLELNRSFPNVKVIAISGGPEGEEACAAGVGSRQTFQKPFDMSACSKPFVRVGALAAKDNIKSTRARWIDSKPRHFSEISAHLLDRSGWFGPEFRQTLRMKP
jgi:CheY-like chemotaxis protein